MFAGLLSVGSQRDDLVDLFRRESNCLGLDDEAEALAVSGTIESIARLTTGWIRKRADLLIATDSLERVMHIPPPTIRFVNEYHNNSQPLPK